MPVYLISFTRLQAIQGQNLCCFISILMAHKRHLPYSLRTRSFQHVTQPSIPFFWAEESDTTLPCFPFCLWSFLLSLLLEFLRRTTFCLMLFTAVSWLLSFAITLFLFSVAVIPKLQFQACMSHIQKPKISPLKLNTGGGKSRFTVMSTGNSVYSYIMTYYCITFHTNNFCPPPNTHT